MVFVFLCKAAAAAAASAAAAVAAFAAWAWWRQVSPTDLAAAQGVVCVTWVVDKLFSQADGLVSIEAVVSDRHGHDVSVMLHKPTTYRTGTVEDIIRLNYNPGTSFKIDQARIIVRSDGREHVIVFNQGHLRTLLSVVLNAVNTMSTSEDASIEGLPVSAEFRWVGIQSSRHDVTPAICALAGPRNRWYHGTPLTVSRKTLITESLRHLYDVRTAHHMWKHINTAEITIVFADGSRKIIDSSNDHELSLPFIPDLINKS